MPKHKTPNILKHSYAEALLIASIITFTLLVALPVTQMLSGKFDQQTGPHYEPIPWEPPRETPFDPPKPPEPQKNQIEDLDKPPPKLSIGVIEVLLNPDLSGFGTVPVAGIIPEAGIDGLIHEIGDLTRAPRPLRQTPPSFPHEMKKAQIEGDVWLEFIVAADGTTRSIQVVRSTNPAFENPAKNAVRRWVFKPGEKDGQEVHTRVRIQIPFRIN